MNALCLRYPLYHPTPYLQTYPHMYVPITITLSHRHTPGNVFTDLTAEYVATLLGENIAQAVVIAVKLPVIYMLIITYVFNIWVV